ncbi:MAG: hypothetical protein ACOH16_10735 [Propionibacteriaceae bacterium]
MASNDLFQPSRLAAASLGLGVGGLVAIVAALVTGSLLGATADQSPWGLSGGLAFWAGALMGPAALVTGIIAKIRVRQPGWWSTIGILVGAITLVIVLVTLVLILAITQTTRS